MQVELTCPDCEAEITEWSFDNVICPNCKAEWEPDYEMNYDDDIQGLRITKKVELETK
jgi:uncharacterized Zn ribbon protein